MNLKNISEIKNIRKLKSLLLKKLLLLTVISSTNQICAMDVEMKDVDDYSCSTDEETDTDDICEVDTDYEDESTFSCSLCKTKFSFEVSAKLHLESYHNICSTCEQQFNSYKDLEEHKQKRHAIKVYDIK